MAKWRKNPPRPRRPKTSRASLTRLAPVYTPRKGPASQALNDLLKAALAKTVTNAVDRMLTNAFIHAFKGSKA